MIDALTAFIVENSASPWALIAVFALSMLDGLIPPLPSESIVIALAAISASTGAPSLVNLGLCAAIGAFLGDNLTFLIARHSGVGRLANSSRPRVQRAFGWAATELHRRSGLAIIVARYIPIGRIAVNLTAGASRFSYPRFIALRLLGSRWRAGGPLDRASPLGGSVLGHRFCGADRFTRGRPLAANRAVDVRFRTHLQGSLREKMTACAWRHHSARLGAGRPRQRARLAWRAFASS